MQETVVLKFGGTSVGTLDRIRAVARLVAAEARAGSASGKGFPVVVVSAMAGETNRLIQLAQDLCPRPSGPAFDLLVASGEQVSCSLLALALGEMGVRARPMLAHQAGIETDSLFSNARIQTISLERLGPVISAGEVPVIAGFQGVDAVSGQVTTLGRGGSDTSAVAIAAALGSLRCDIYTDVDGIYTADPRIVPKSRRITRLSYDEMMELASLGAKVLHMRCVELAAKYRVPLRVLSSFEPQNGGSEIMAADVLEKEFLESPVVSAVTSDSAEALLDVRLTEEQARFPARFFRPLADQGINVDVIVKSPAQADGTCSISFTVPKSECDRAARVLASQGVGSGVSVAQTGVVKVSIVGIGMRTHSGVAARMFETLEKNGIPILLVTTSEIKVSVLVQEQHRDLAIRSLHQEFGLG